MKRKGRIKGNGNYAFLFLVPLSNFICKSDSPLTGYQLSTRRYSKTVILLWSNGYNLILSIGINCEALKNTNARQPWWERCSGLAPPAAQGVILETLDRVPRQALCMEPASPSACVSASLSLSASL